VHLPPAAFARGAKECKALFADGPLLLSGSSGFSLCAETFVFGFQSFESLLNDRGSFAAGHISLCESLNVALRFIEFCAFVCHAPPFDTKPMALAWLSAKMRRLWRFLPSKEEKDQDTDDNRQNAADED